MSRGNVTVTEGERNGWTVDVVCARRACAATGQDRVVSLLREEALASAMSNLYEAGWAMDLDGVWWCSRHRDRAFPFGARWRGGRWEFMATCGRCPRVYPLTDLPAEANLRNAMENVLGWCRERRWTVCGKRVRCPQCTPHQTRARPQERPLRLPDLPEWVVDDGVDGAGGQLGQEPERAEVRPARGVAEVAAECVRLGWDPGSSPVIPADALRRGPRPVRGTPVTAPPLGFCVYGGMAEWRRLVAWPAGQAYPVTGRPAWVRDIVCALAASPLADAVTGIEWGAGVMVEFGRGTRWYIEAPAGVDGWTIHRPGDAPVMVGGQGWAEAIAALSALARGVHRVETGEPAVWTRLHNAHPTMAQGYYRGWFGMVQQGCGFTTVRMEKSALLQHPDSWCVTLQEAGVGTSVTGGRAPERPPMVSVCTDNPVLIVLSYIGTPANPGCGFPWGDCATGEHSEAVMLNTFHEASMYAYALSIVHSREVRVVGASSNGVAHFDCGIAMNGDFRALPPVGVTVYSANTGLDAPPERATCNWCRWEGGNLGALAVQMRHSCGMWCGELQRAHSQTGPIDGWLRNVRAANPQWGVHWMETADTANPFTDADWRGVALFMDSTRAAVVVMGEQQGRWFYGWHDTSTAVPRWVTHDIVVADTAAELRDRMADQLALWSAGSTSPPTTRGFCHMGTPAGFDAMRQAPPARPGGVLGCIHDVLWALDSSGVRGDTVLNFEWWATGCDASANTTSGTLTVWARDGRTHRLGFDVARDGNVGWAISSHSASPVEVTGGHGVREAYMQLTVLLHPNHTGVVRSEVASVATMFPGALVGVSGEDRWHMVVAPPEAVDDEGRVVPGGRVVVHLTSVGNLGWVVQMRAVGVQHRVGMATVCTPGSPTALVRSFVADDGAFQWGETLDVPALRWPEVVDIPRVRRLLTATFTYQLALRRAGVLVRCHGVTYGRTAVFEYGFGRTIVMRGVGDCVHGVVVNGLVAACLGRDALDVVVGLVYPRKETGGLARALGVWRRSMAGEGSGWHVEWSGLRHLCPPPQLPDTRGALLISPRGDGTPRRSYVIQIAANTSVHRWDINILSITDTGLVQAVGVPSWGCLSEQGVIAALNEYVLVIAALDSNLRVNLAPPAFATRVALMARLAGMMSANITGAMVVVRHPEGSRMNVCSLPPGHYMLSPPSPMRQSIVDAGGLWRAMLGRDVTPGERVVGDALLAALAPWVGGKHTVAFVRETMHAHFCALVVGTWGFAVVTGNATGYAGVFAPVDRVERCWAGGGLDHKAGTAEETHRILAQCLVEEWREADTAPVGEEQHGP